MNADYPVEDNSELKAGDRNEILELVASGKISIDEATRLLRSSKLEEPQEKEKEEESDAPEVEEPFLPEFGNGGNPRWFHVQVSDIKTGKSKVQVNIPLRLVKFGLAVGKRFSPEIGDMDLDELSEVMMTEKGLLVDVQDDEDGERVLIYVD